MIVSISWSSVGMNRRAIVTIRASSSVGTRRRRRGRPSQASASVSAIGGVVSVSSRLATISTTSRKLR